MSERDQSQPMGSIVPYVIERTGRGEQVYDIYSRLLKDRIIFLGMAINDAVANAVVAQLLFLQMEGKKQDISLYINSPGGSVSAGLSIYDTMQFIQCDIATYCIGQAASMGAVLMTAGTPGKRFALPHARLMIHQPWGGVEGTAADISIHAKEIVRRKDELYNILARHTKKPVDQIKHDSDRDFFLSADEAKDYGLIDEVVTSLRDGMPGAGPSTTAGG